MEQRDPKLTGHHGNHLRCVAKYVHRREWRKPRHIQLTGAYERRHYYALDLTPGFTSDVTAGSIASLRMSSKTGHQGSVGLLRMRQPHQTHEANGDVGFARS